MTESMVKRVGEALAAECMKQFGSTWSNDVRWALARAAIAAMREPTEAMCEVVAFGSYTTFSYGGDENSFDYFSKENAADVFRDMIDAALQETTHGKDTAAKA